MGFPDTSVGKESACNAGDPGSIPGSKRSSGEGIGYPLQYSWASLVAQLVKNLSAMQETWVLSLGWEDPLEKGKATHSIFWPGKFSGVYSPRGRKDLDTTEQLSLIHMPYNSSCCCCSVAKSCPTLCEPKDCRTSGSSVHHYLLEFAQNYVH